MTLCEELGYKVGDLFEVLYEAEGFRKGQLVELFKDTGDNEPLFKGDNLFYTLCDHEMGAYIHLDDLKVLSYGCKGKQFKELTDGEMCSRYQFDDNPVIMELVKRLVKANYELENK